MAKTIYLLQFNNYFNRTLKGPYGRVDDYTYNGATIVGQITNMSLWNPNDGVDTTITSNLGLTAVPDYCLVEDGAMVVQRWFVTEAKRLQGQQYRLTLHRDVLAEENEKIMSNTESYIERGWCDASDPAIYNSEPMTFNQIKQSQTLMYDKTISPWIVGYIQAPQEDTTIKYEAASGLYQVTIPTAIKYARGCPYAIFYMPYETFTWYADNTLTNGVSQPAEVSLGLAGEISRKFSGAGILLDLQVLPFCPQINVGYEGGYRSGYVPTFKIEIKKDAAGGGTETAGYMGLITATPHTSGDVYKKTGGQGTPLSNAKLEITVTDIKKDSSTQTARIVSPNGNGIWEFSPAKQVYSNGSVTGFGFNMTCKPYQPFIKVEPAFGRMYGNDYQDARGMICTGDFSLPQVSDAWTTYQIQNKNYEGMFNRQIESLDLQQKWALRSDIANATTGAVSGIAGGAMTGSMIGGGVGAVVGGVVGAVGAAVGGGMDIVANKELRADQRSAMIDQHNMALGNIRAMPSTVTKLGSVLADQPLNPYLEIYDCTDKEKTNFDNYLSLKSYNISRYGKFSDYVKPTGRTWLQGTFVRLNGISDDSHYLAAIADEVKQGFYIEKGES